MEQKWLVTYTTELAKKKKRHKGGVVVVQGGKATLFSSPEDDGRRVGPALATTSATLTQGEEMMFGETHLVYISSLADDEDARCGAAVVGHAPAKAAHAPLSLQQRGAAPFRPPAQAFRPPAAAAPPASAPPPLRAPVHPPAATPAAAFAREHVPPVELARASAPAPAAPHRPPALAVPAPAMMSNEQLYASFEEWGVAPGAGDALDDDDWGCDAACELPTVSRSGDGAAAATSDDALLAPIVEWGGAQGEQHGMDDHGEDGLFEAACCAEDEAGQLWGAHTAAAAADDAKRHCAAAPSAAAAMRLPLPLVRTGAAMAAAAFRPPAATAGVPAAGGRASGGYAAASPSQAAGMSLRFTRSKAVQPAIPARPACPVLHCRALAAALEAFLQAQLTHDACRLHAAVAAAACGTGDVAAIKRAARAARPACPYYASAELSVWPSEHGGKRARSEQGGEQSSEGPSFTLKLADGERERSTEYAKHDVWVMSTAPLLDAGALTASCFTLVGVSTYHGPTPDGKLGLKLLCPLPPGFGASRRTVRLHALRCFNASGELDQYAALMELAEGGAATLPLLPALMRLPAAGASGSGLDMGTVEIMDRFGLNEDQARVVSTAAAATLSAEPRVLLVQGPFGCGKTHTLSALVRQLCTELSTAGSKERILIAGYTNACVDGLLCALLDAGFDDFARYGSLRRIAPRILPHAVGSRAGGGASKADDDERDLRAALEGARTASERATVTAELEAVEAGRSAARMRRLAACRVVAVTTASCTQERLHGQKFACVLLDEASQLTEPAALLPLVRFGARCCVLVGDPEQLSPLLVNLDADCDLGRPLFVRLASVGHSPTLLRTQYRCHPAISAVPNLQFYGGRLLDGVTAAQRAPLLPSLPPLVFLDVDHRSPAIGGNDAEATLTQRVVRMLCGAGVPPSDIACITFLRDHVSRTHQSVNRSTNYGEQGLLCSTIDAFQGQERDVIVLSFAGLQPQFASAQRINVALSRARRHLICIGSSTGALRGQAWFAALLAAARRTPRAYSRITDLRDALPRFDEAPALPLPPPAEEMDIICDSPPRGAAGGSSEDAKACARLSLASVGAARASDEDDDDVCVIDDAVDDSPLDAADAADAEPFMCSVPAEAAFAAAAFSGADLWAGYKAFHVLQYATVKPATAERAAFFATKFGTVLRGLYPSDGRRRSLQRPFTHLHMQAEAYVAKHCGGAHVVRLSALLAAHEDVATLRLQHPAFAWHVLRDAEEEDAADGALGARASREPDAVAPEPTPEDAGAVGLTETDYLF